MVNVCVVFGCSNTSTNLISLHQFPKEHNALKLWERFVNRTRVWDKSSASSRICSKHFKPDDFENYIQVTLGGAKKLRLKDGAIPSIYPEGTCFSKAKTNEKERSVFRKREATRVSCFFPFQLI